ncbi:2,3-diketo-L-gulonate TRAP transporter, substrate-binding periplasmic protein [Escherichia coli]|nr:2,3-diketo-L-gulonate TRAP transporter, substrate-binding periplasmic protein [Escherichia coli]
MKLRSVTYALFIAGLAAFSTSSMAAQSLRFGYETSQNRLATYCGEKIQ